MSAAERRGWAAHTHTATATALPAPCTFLLSAPGPTHCSHQSHGWWDNCQHQHSENTLQHPAPSSHCRTSHERGQCSRDPGHLDTLSRYLDRGCCCTVTRGHVLILQPGSTAGGGQADSHGPRSSLVEAVAGSMNHLATPHNTHCPGAALPRGYKPVSEIRAILHNLQLAIN